jgi:hypothetical protein
MKIEQMKQLLVQLHQGLQSGESVDPELRGLLQTLNSDISNALAKQDLQEQESANDPMYSALSERSQILSAQFAAKHPHLEMALREVSEILGKMGV